MKQKLAVITGADGGMGMEITCAVATAGYKKSLWRVVILKSQKRSVS